MNLAKQYISDVISGNIVVGEFIRLASERHLSDLAKQDDEDFPYYFDEESAEKPIKYFGILKHAKGRWGGEKFQLLPWQAFPMWCVYGWKRKDNNLRRYRKVYIKVARKNGKTELMSGIGNYGFTADREKDPEIYWVATKKDQAKIGWTRQKTQIELLRSDSTRIRDYCDTLTYSIFTKKGDGFVSYLGKDSKTEDGRSPYYGLIDEYHEHPTDDMINVIESGMGSRLEPLTWIITTAGFNPNSPCARFEKTCKQILRGQIDDDQIFSLIYDLDETDDWEDQSVWIKANPSLGQSLTLDYLISEYQLAKTQGGSKEVNFKTKNLNIWTAAASTWIQDDVWMKHSKPFDISLLYGRKCYGGLDLASTRDLCSLALFFPAEKEGEQHRALWWYWTPEENAQERQKNDSIPYLEWAKEGLIELTPGNVTDYNYIQNTIINLHENFNVQRIGYDRYNSSQLVINLQDEGFKMNPFGQGFRSMSEPTKELERQIRSGALNHGGNPVTRWQCGNVTIEMDASENVKITKSKSSEKVDGMVALVMAIGEWMDAAAKGNGRSVYDERGVLMV